MRGGAWPLLIFGSLLVIFGIGNRIWTEDAIQSATYAFAAAASYLTAAALSLAGRGEAARRGAPPPGEVTRAIPAASAGAVVLALGAGTLGLGFVYGKFLVFGGGGLLALGCVLLARELHAQRRATVGGGPP
jgi:hypothetical protein